MITIRYMRTRGMRLWRQRRTREVAVAVVLTIAAAGFITVAMLRGDNAAERGATHVSARKAATP